jgi:hypothetical protein
MSEPAGRLFHPLLNELYEASEHRPIHIVETGCMRDLSLSSEYTDGWSTLYISRWVSRNSKCCFDSVDLNINAIELAHLALETEKLAKYCTFHCEDSLKFLSRQSWIDFAFLDSCDGLDHGLQEFRLASSVGARMVVMDDYQTKAATAIREAINLGWKFEQKERYSILRRQT